MDPRLNFKQMKFHTPMALNNKILDTIPCPIFVIGGTRGFIGLRWKHSQKVLKKYNNAQLELIEGGHHLHCEEEAVGKVGDLVSNFLFKVTAQWDADAANNNSSSSSIKQKSKL